MLLLSHYLFEARAWSEGTVLLILKSIIRGKDFVIDGMLLIGFLMLVLTHYSSAARSLPSLSYLVSSLVQESAWLYRLETKKLSVTKKSYSVLHLVQYLLAYSAPSNPSQTVSMIVRLVKPE